MARIATIIGTRPEIIKMAPVVKAIDKLDHEHILVHSGQHYDMMMDEIFFKELGLRDPDYKFEVKDMPPHRQIASTIERAGEIVRDVDLVIVQGDTNTTVAGAILGSKLGKPVGHVEAGIRSYDKTMPEEVNRILTDQMSALLFSPTATAKHNLERENISKGVHVVGNSVVDALVQNIRRAEERASPLKRFGAGPRSYFLVTFHRAENADNPEKLRSVLLSLTKIAQQHGKTVLFPMHPRTRKRVEEFGLQRLLDARGLEVVDPIGYFDMLILEKFAAMILTDSGGLQEEACILHVPCVTLRENTERPETLSIGCNVLAGTEAKRIEVAARRQLRISTKWRNPYGNGTTGEKIATLVSRFLARRGSA
jgi:UDP-N-acetylglucosamine 2-epimerase (non-hydrolysing)